MKTFIEYLNESESKRFYNNKYKILVKNKHVAKKSLDNIKKKLYQEVDKEIKEEHKDSVKNDIDVLFKGLKECISLDPKFRYLDFNYTDILNLEFEIRFEDKSKIFYEFLFDVPSELNVRRFIKGNELDVSYDYDDPYGNGHYNEPDIDVIEDQVRDYVVEKMDDLTKLYEKIMKKYFNKIKSNHISEEEILVHDLDIEELNDDYATINFCVGLTMEDKLE